MSRSVRFVALVAIAVALAVPAWAAGEREVEYVTLTFYGLDSRSKTLVDKAPLGDTPSKGDVIRLTLRLINSGSQFGKASGARVGSAVQTYTFTSRRKATVTQLATLPTGTIRTGGIADTQGFQQNLASRRRHENIREGRRNLRNDTDSERLPGSGLLPATSLVARRRR